MDLFKAYDRVDWTFLENTLHKMGFSHRWVQWIMSSVTMVKYSFKFNGNLLEAFSPTRGLRQRDSLSPFLFLFVDDGLSTLLKHEVDQNRIFPIKVCRQALGIYHLLFADDTLRFSRASEVEAACVRNVLSKYA